MTLAGGRQRSDSDSCEARSGGQARLLAARTTPDPWRGMLDEPKIVQPHLLLRCQHATNSLSTVLLTRRPCGAALPIR